MKEEELDLEIPGDDDENVGEGVPKKKKEKRKKSKEERIAERKVVFWTLVVVIVITFLFWFVPKVGGMSLSIPEINLSLPKIEAPKQEMKNYVEYKL